MSDIFQEVDEEVRRDKAVEFWTKYQNVFIVIAVLIVLATAGFRYYEYRRVQAADAAGAEFQNALKLERDGKGAEAGAAFVKLASDGPAGYRLLARFSEADAKTKADPKAGAASFDALADDSALDPLFRDAARLRAALARVDAGDIAAAKTGFEALATPEGPYRVTARLTLASLALEAKDYAAAGKLLDQVVADPETPQTERRAAESLLGLVASNSPAK